MELLCILLFTYFGTGVLLALQLLLVHVSMRRVLIGHDPALKAEACEYFEIVSRLKGGFGGTLLLTLIAPWVAMTRLGRSVQ